MHSIFFVGCFSRTPQMRVQGIPRAYEGKKPFWLPTCFLKQLSGSSEKRQRQIKGKKAGKGRFPCRHDLSPHLFGHTWPVLTPMCVYGLTLYLVKPPSWGNVSGGCPSPSSFSQGICRAAGQTLCVSTSPLSRDGNRCVFRHPPTQRNPEDVFSTN